MTNNPDHFCRECGRPEKGNYKPPTGRTFQCSICLHNMLIREKKEDEEKKEKEKAAQKAKQEALARRPVRVRKKVKMRPNAKRRNDGRFIQ